MCTNGSRALNTVLLGAWSVSIIFKSSKRVIWTKPKKAIWGVWTRREGAVASGRAWSAWLPPSHCVSSRLLLHLLCSIDTVHLLPTKHALCYCRKLWSSARAFQLTETHTQPRVKVEVILQEQFPTTSGPVEDTAHIPEHRHSAPRYLRQPSTQVLEVSKYSGTQVHGYSGTHVLEVSKYSSAQCSVVLAPSHHLWPGGNCSWYVCSPVRATLLLLLPSLFPSFQLWRQLQLGICRWHAQQTHI